MNRDADRPSGFHGVIRQIGYTAMGVGSAAAAVYGITRAFRKRDLGALWAFDPRAAPPMSVQRQLRVGSDSDDDSDGEPPPKLRRRTIREATHMRDELEEEMRRAMRSNDMARVQRLSRRLDDMDSESRAVPSDRARRERAGLQRSRDSGERRWRGDDVYDTPNRHHTLFMPSYSEERSVHSEAPRFERSRSYHEAPAHNSRSGHVDRVDRASAGSPTHSVRRRKVVDPQTARRLDAMSKLQIDDLVKAPCPCSGQVCDATICALRDGGLVEVRWHNPGTDGSGRSFQPYGDVWADAIQLVYRKHSATKQAPYTCRSPGLESDKSVLPNGLSVGTPCFALGVLVKKEWYQAKILGVRPKSPQVRIEYVATLDGDTAPLILPEPKKTHVPPEFLQQSRPDPTSAAAAYYEALYPTGAQEGRSSAPVQQQESASGEERSTDSSEERSTDSPRVVCEGARPSGETEAAASSQEDDAPIDPDLMCKICNRPDQEHLMLLCEECRAGFHTFCITPPLPAVPEHDWYCTQCSAKRSAE